MLHLIPRLRVSRVLLGSLASVLTWSTVAVAQDTAPQAPQDEQPGAGGAEMGEVVVTAYRQSLAIALDQKQKASAAIDMIVAEDIADFPDLNLAEAIQRVPGVSIARDAGEGRQVTVRGLGPQFTRVRINGIEALTTNGGTDAAGGTNRGRNFDFNTFASELFNNITVRKTASAEVEEGSVGATVDLRTGRPFDYNGLTFLTQIQGGYNDVSEDVSPRASVLISNTFGDGRWGALFSAAYTDRSLLDEGSSTVRWQNGGTCPVPPAALGAGCFGSLGANYGASGSTATLTELNSAFRPRIPRYDKYEHEQDRIGLTGSLQFQPSDSTQLTFDALYSEFNAERSEIFLESQVFSTNGMAGINDVDVQAAQIGANNTIVFGVFDDVDIRSEARFDELETRFYQFTLDGVHSFSDTVRLHGLAGFAQSNHDNPVQTTILFDANNIDGYTFDYRGDDRLPLITYGTTDVTNPATWTISQIRLRPQSTLNTFKTVSFDVDFVMSDAFTLKAGPQWKEYEFVTTEARRPSETVIPANVTATPIADYSEVISFGDGLGVPGGTPTSWRIPDLQTAASLFGLYDTSLFPLSITPALGNNNTIEEEDIGGYVQLDWNAELMGRPLRGNVGVRYVETKQKTTGWLTQNNVPVLTTTERDYDNTLPSLNLVFEATEDFLIRLGAAKTMTRPPLGQITPGGTASVSGNNKTVTTGNPELNPFEADNYDVALEWYFAPESLVSVAFFYKDIDTFVQTIRTTNQQFSANPLGLDDSVALSLCGPAVPADTCLAGWEFSVPANTPGGDLDGFEISYQQPFTFLPAPFNGFGAIINYTAVDSKVKYLDQNGLVVADTDLVGLSQSAYNATLYFENERFSARVSAAYRDEYLTTVPGRNGNDVEGTAETLNIDAAASFTLNENIEFTLEALNLTDEFQDQWVDSSGDRLSYYHHPGREYFIGARFRF
jgi:TonB-dependent receptor